jgi:hypothetical protein
MKRTVLILLLILPISLLAQKPKSKDIDDYVKQNESQFIIDYQYFVKDTIYNDIFFATANFRKLFGKDYNQSTLAFNTMYEGSSCEITVNNEERYVDYDYTKVRHKENYGETDYFIRATVFHEISHYYFAQVILEMRKIRGAEVSEYYTYSLRQFPNVELQYGAKFIEEGICEYLRYKWGLAPEIKMSYMPTSKNEIIKQGEKYPILYGYSSQFVKEFMDLNIKLYGRPKNALMILLHNRPPNYEEILHPEKYYQRLIIY